MLFFYATTSEVAWLFLLSYWVAAMVAACFVYAIWNGRISVEVRLAAIRHAGDPLPAGVPDGVAVDRPFEQDGVDVAVVCRSAGRARGPVRVSGHLGDAPVALGFGAVTRSGVRETRSLGPARRGVLAGTGWLIETGDPLGLFARRRSLADQEVALVLPRFARLARTPQVRDLEAAASAPRAGHGTEVFGVREYRPGDPLRRIHWRTTARRGELTVREFEPPGVQHLGVFLEAEPADAAHADQVARLAASEAWGCLQAGGRVTLWAPGCEPTRPDEERNLVALLEWLARYPNPAPQDEPAPLVGDAVAVTGTSDFRLLDALEDVRAHGGSVRAWVVGEAVLESDVDLERAGLRWPL